MPSARGIRVGIELVCPEAEYHGDRKISASESLILFLPAPTLCWGGAPREHPINVSYVPRSPESTASFPGTALPGISLVRPRGLQGPAMEEMRCGGLPQLSGAPRAELTSSASDSEPRFHGNRHQQLSKSQLSKLSNTGLFQNLLSHDS